MKYSFLKKTTFTSAKVNLSYDLINSAILRGCRESLTPCRSQEAAPLAECGTASHDRSSALKKVNFWAFLKKCSKRGKNSVR